jgi:hypothetical protein
MAILDLSDVMKKKIIPRCDYLVNGAVNSFIGRVERLQDNNVLNYMNDY